MLQINNMLQHCYPCRDMLFSWIQFYFLICEEWSVYTHLIQIKKPLLSLLLRWDAQKRLQDTWSMRSHETVQQTHSPLEMSVFSFASVFVLLANQLDWCKCFYPLSAHSCPLFETCHSVTVSTVLLWEWDCLIKHSHTNVKQWKCVSVSVSVCVVAAAVRGMNLQHLFGPLLQAGLRDGWGRKRQKLRRSRRRHFILFLCFTGRPSYTLTYKKVSLIRSHSHSPVSAESGDVQR